MSKRLYRSETDRVLGGVCGGLSDYIGIPSVFLRIFFVLWLIMGNYSVLAYLILWLVIPRSSGSGVYGAEDFIVRLREMGQEVGMALHEPSRQLITYAGVGLIGWGVYYLLQRLGLPWLSTQYTWYIWPVLLILAGIVVLIKTISKRK